MKKNNKGFTLVELIVVLVILAILAAILVPALLGYIDNAKNKQTLLNARSAMIAAQAELSAMYAKNLNPASCATASDAHHLNLCSTADFANLNPSTTKFSFKCSEAFNSSAITHGMYTITYVYYEDATSKVEYKNGEWVNCSSASETDLIEAY